MGIIDYFHTRKTFWDTENKHHLHNNMLLLLYNFTIRTHAHNLFVFLLICVNIWQQMSPGQLKSLQRQKSALNVSGISMITLHCACTETTLGFSAAHDRLKGGSDTHHSLLEVNDAFASRVNNNSTGNKVHPGFTTITAVRWN